MKKFQKIVAIGAAFAMAMSMGVSAFAEDAVEGFVADKTHELAEGQTTYSTLKIADYPITLGEADTQYTVILIPAVLENDTLTDDQILYLNQGERGELFWANMGTKAGTLTAEAANATLDIDFDDAGTNAIANNSGKASTTHYYLIPVKNTYNVTFNVELIQAGVSVGKYDRTATVEIDLQKGISYDVKAILNDKNATTNELFPIEFTVDGVEGWPTTWTEQSATVQK